MSPLSQVRRKLKTNRNFLFLFVFFTSLFSAVTFRHDQNPYSDFIAGITFIPDTLRIINTYAPYSAILTILSAALIFTTRGRRRVKIHGTYKLIIFLTALIAIRLVFYNVDLAQKEVLLLIELIVIYASVYYARKTMSSDELSTILRYSLLLFCTFLTILNLYLYTTGGVINSWVNRFYGSSTHPNFLGVQMGICGVVFYAFIRRRRSLMTASAVMLLLISFGILITTGSRTGLLMFFTSITTFWFVSKSRSLLAINIVVLILFVIIFLAIVYQAQGGSLPDSLDRGGVNTRAESWAGMWSTIWNNPILGSPAQTNYVESSYLLGWARFGLFFPLIYVLIVYIIAQQIKLVLKQNAARRGASLSVSIVVGIFISAILEGMLVDTYTFVINVFALNVITLDCITGDVLLSDNNAKARRSFNDHRRAAMLPG